MTTTWALKTVGLFVVTVGALLMVAYLWNAPPYGPESSTPKGKHAYDKHRRLSTVAMGLLAVWLVMQYIGVLT